MKQQRDRIRDAGKLLDGSRQILGLLYNSDKSSSAYDQVASALDVTIDLKRDSFFAALVEPMEAIYYSLQDLSGRISEFKDKLEFEPGELEEVENRLYLISKLKNKYGESIKKILIYLKKARAETKILGESEEQQEKVENEIIQITSEYMHMATAMSQKRTHAAMVLKQKIQEELLYLNMPNINFEVSVERKNTPGVNGIHSIDIPFSANPGEEMKPVIRIASGGRNSRSILALKTALAGVFRIPTSSSMKSMWVWVVQP